MLKRSNELAVGASLARNQMVSYAELGSNIELVRERIRHHHPINQRVAVLANKSPHAYAVMIAALCEGFAFIPIHPDWPKSRVQSILSRLKCDFLFFEQRFAALAASLPARSECIDWQDQRVDSGRGAVVSVANEMPAYFLLTSGSTGEPKAVEISRANLAQFLNSMQSVVPVSAKDRFTQLYDLSFDLAIGEILYALANGASLHPIERGDLALFFKKISHIKPSVISLTPSMARFALESGIADKATFDLSCKTLFCGERLVAEVVQSWRSRVPLGRIYNFYGPTEATIYSTYAEITQSAQGEAPTIGRPLPGMKYIIDKMNDSDVDGELWLSGGQIFKGYVGDFAASDRVLIKKHDAIWYRTGDWVRLNADGEIVFIGRRDRQIKFRGYRIELDEIEHHARLLLGREDILIEHITGKSESIVLVVRSEGSGAQNSEDWFKEIKKKLAMVLPAYSLPTHCVFVNEWPLNSSGKLDRLAIRSLVSNRLGFES